MGEFYPGAKPDFIESIKEDNSNLGKLNMEESKLLEDLDKFQRKEILKINKNFFLEALNKIKIYIKTRKKIDDIFFFKLVEKLKLDDLDIFFREGFIKTNNKKLLSQVFSKLLFDENIVKVASLLPLVKSIGLEIYPDLGNLITYTQDRKDIKTILLGKFRSLLKKSNLDFDDIELINFPIEIISNSIEFVSKETSNKTASVLETNVIKTEKLIEELVEIIEDKNEEKIISKKDSKDSNKGIIKKAKKSEKPKKILEKKSLLISPKKLVEEKLIEIEYDENIDFFSLLEQFKKTKRKNNDLMPKSLYKSFILKSNEKNFFKFLELEKSTLSRTSLDLDILILIFDRLISFSRKDLVKLNEHKGYNLRLLAIKDKIIKLGGDNSYEAKYADYISEFKILRKDGKKETSKAYIDKIALEEKKKVDFILFQISTIEDLSNKQVDVFFELIKEFRFGNRSDSKIMTDSLYITFIRSSSKIDFLKLLELEKMTIVKNNLGEAILEEILFKLMDFDLDENRGYLLKRIENIKTKLLEKTNGKFNNLDLLNKYKLFLIKYKNFVILKI